MATINQFARFSSSSLRQLLCVAPHSPIQYSRTTNMQEDVISARTTATTSTTAAINQLHRPELAYTNWEATMMSTSTITYVNLIFATWKYVWRHFSAFVNHSNNNWPCGFPLINQIRKSEHWNSHQKWESHHVAALNGDQMITIGKQNATLRHAINGQEKSAFDGSIITLDAHLAPPRSFISVNVFLSWLVYLTARFFFIFVFHGMTQLKLCERVHFMNQWKLRYILNKKRLQNSRSVPWNACITCCNWMRRKITAWNH